MQTLMRRQMRNILLANFQRALVAPLISTCRIKENMNAGPQSTRLMILLHLSAYLITLLVNDKCRSFNLLHFVAGTFSMGIRQPGCRGVETIKNAFIESVKQMLTIRCFLSTRSLQSFITIMPVRHNYPVASSLLIPEGCKSVRLKYQQQWGS